MNDPSEFAQKVLDKVLAHIEHGTWYETDAGLHCGADDVLVVPSGNYLIAHDGVWP